MNILEFKNLSIKYQNEKSAVDNVSFYVPEGSIVAIVGESGSGKSTIIRAAIGLLPQGGKVESGEILFSGNNLLDLSEDELRRMRGNQISMVFQDTGSYLNPRIKIGKQYLELLKIHMEDYSKDKAYDLAVNMLSKMKLPDPKNVMKSYPFQLSGGMLQRVAIAMAISMKPRLLLADEPTSALDVTIQAQILELLADLRKEYGMAIIMISHDLGVIASLCDRVCVMYAGRIVEEGSARQVFYQPAHPYAQGLLKSLPGLDSDRSEPLPVIAGQPPDLLLDIKGCSFLPRCPYAMIVCHENLPEPVMLEGGHSCWCWKSYKEQEEVASDE